MSGTNLPHNTEAEQGLLGSLLVENKMLAKLPENFSANAFFSPVHARIFEAIRATVVAGGTASPITLKNYFNDDACYEALRHVGGAGKYLGNLASAVITIVNTADYARSIMDCALRRETIAACETAILAASTPDIQEPFEAGLSKLRDAVDSAERVFSVGRRASTALPMVYADDVVPSLVTSDFVEDLLCENQLSVVYGESNCGKTFFTMDLALHIACGLRWRDKRVDRGGVLYCALEGGQGTNNRVAAFKEHHGVSSGVSLAIVPVSINLLCDDDVSSLVASVGEAAGRFGKIRLIVIDTLSRALSGGDENSSEDMGRLVIVADKLRSLCSAHICFIHHSGKDSAKGARGHSLMRAAVDTEIEISRNTEDGYSLMRVVKQREMDMIGEMAFRLERMVLGQDFRGKDITSCVVMPWEVGDSVSDGRSVSDSLPPAQRFLFDAIVEAISAHPSIRLIDGVERTVVDRECVLRVMVKRGDRDWADLEAFKRSTAPTHKALKNRGLIGLDKNYCWLY